MTKAGERVQKLSRRAFVRRMLLGSISVPILMECLHLNLVAQEDGQRQMLIWLKGHASSVQSAGVWSLPELPEFLAKFFNVVSIDNLDTGFYLTDYLENDPSFILILEGFFPDDPDSSLNNLLKDLIVVSRAVILVGSESAYQNLIPDGFMDLESDLLHHVETPFFKLPGVPMPMRHLLGALNHIYLYGLPELDEYRRPKMFYSVVICERCQYRGDFERGNFVRHFGEKEGCLYLLGCKGPITKNTCPIEKWNGTTNWCVAAGSPCTGCSEPGYPIHSGLGMYGQLSAGEARVNSPILRYTDTIAKGTLAVATTAVLLHAISKRTSSSLRSRKMTSFDEDFE